MSNWRYDVQYGPEGEAAYAWVYDAGGHMVGTMRLHHAVAIVDAMNTLSKAKTKGINE